METSTEKLMSVLEHERIASTPISDLVPATHDVGRATTANGTNVEYTLTDFVSDTVDLESVWPSLDAVQRPSLIDAIVVALEKIQQSHDHFEHVGGPHIGYANNMRDFLTLFVAKHQTKSQPTSTITDTPDGIVIKSALPDLDDVFLSNDDLQALYDDATHCHNDLEPRNILIRRSKDDVSQYQLAAIIDWEMVGFFPFAFETAVKDTALGCANLHFDWYTMFKSKTKHLIAPGEHSNKLIEAVRLIVDSRSLQWKRNRLELHEDLQLGWVKKDAAKPWAFSKRKNDELEMQVLKDFGIVE
ncbi:hypothetical protein CC86DRAFT_395841 [Ophiobolus disseminans]|uniref:Aminoglycoside phosphotransferase domain-containing protein n=1 Tax=Ophiobolus disseminans TaxID=1469910 RepID=A0A6A6ZSI8_9PLEO|nr:hypothetical protein CC86DRAFT_395841 [Ophiobolus disseminans]